MMERDFEEKLVQRDFPLEVREVEKEDRTLEFPFSSEKGVERYFVNEVLEHKTKSANLERLNDGAPLLWNHDQEKVIGVVEKAWIDEKKRRGYAKVRFSEEEFAIKIPQGQTFLYNGVHPNGVSGSSMAASGSALSSSLESVYASLSNVTAKSSSPLSSGSCDLEYLVASL